MRILITGVSGQVGSALVPALKAIGAVRVKMSKSDIRKNKSRFRCSIDLRPRKFPAGESENHDITASLRQIQSRSVAELPPFQRGVA
jgi:nucleoside-diphosphate-sugar epimerase